VRNYVEKDFIFSSVSGCYKGVYTIKMLCSFLKKDLVEFSRSKN